MKITSKLLRDQLDKEKEKLKNSEHLSPFEESILKNRGEDVYLLYKVYELLCISYEKEYGKGRKRDFYIEFNKAFSRSKLLKERYPDWDYTIFVVSDIFEGTYKVLNALFGCGDGNVEPQLQKENDEFDNKI